MRRKTSAIPPRDNDWATHSADGLEWIIERDATTAEMVERFHTDPTYEARPVALFLTCTPPGLRRAYYFAGLYSPDHLYDERGPHITWRRYATRMPVLPYEG